MVRLFLYIVCMKLIDFNKQQLLILAEKVNRNPEHLRKIARGERRCPSYLAEAIEKASGGILTKEDLTWPND